MEKEVCKECGAVFTLLNTSSTCCWPCEKAAFEGAGAEVIEGPDFTTIISEFGAIDVTERGTV